MMTPIDRQILGALIRPFGGQLGADCKRPLAGILFTLKSGEISGFPPCWVLGTSKYIPEGLILGERSDQTLKGTGKASGC